MAEKLICPICGEPTRVYMGNARKDRLCGAHADELKAGKIERCEDCGRYHNVDQTCSCKGQPKYTELPRTGFDACVKCGAATKGYAFCKTCWGNYDDEELLEILNSKGTSTNTSQKENDATTRIINEIATEENQVCIVCGNATSSNHPWCSSCYAEIRDYMDGLDKNSSMKEFRDYYYNLKDAIFRMSDFTLVKTNCNKLIAIAIQNSKLNGDSSLIHKVVNDVKKLIEAKKPKDETIEVDQDAKDRDTRRINIHTSVDGHCLKSQMETIVDDALWNLHILHAYEKPIIEFINERKKCDWFIPILNNEGIYIEYWGMTTAKYLQERAEKEELYKKYDVPYISIEKDDPKDSQSLTTFLQQEIQRLAYERWGFCPKWKK